MPNFPTGPGLQGLPQRPQARVRLPLPSGVAPATDAASRVKSPMPPRAGAEPAPLRDPAPRRPPPPEGETVFNRVVRVILSVVSAPASGTRAAQPATDEARSAMVGREAGAPADPLPRHGTAAIADVAVPERTDGAIPLAIAASVRDGARVSPRGDRDRPRGMKPPDPQDGPPIAALLIVAASLLALGAVLLF